MDMAGIFTSEPPRRHEYTLAFGLPLESTPLRLAASVRSVCALAVKEFFNKRDGTVFFIPNPVNLAL